MTKFFLATFIGSLAVAQSTPLRAEEMLVAVNTNFETASNTADAKSTPPPPSSPANKPVATSAPTTPTVTSAESSTAEQAAREEILRREGAQATARALMDQGQVLYYDGKYQEAVDKLEQAVKILPRAKATEIDYNRATHALSDSYYRLADAAFRAGDYPRAKQLAQKAAEYDPSSQYAENMLVKVKQAERETAQAEREAAQAAKQPPPPEVAGLQAKKDDITKLFREGKLLMNSGLYDQAEQRFKQILVIDPYNDDAYKLLDQLTALRESSSLVAFDAMRQNRLWQVSEAWVSPVGGGVEVPKPGTPGGPAGPSVKTAEIMQKLNDLIFPEVNFREAVVSDVVKFLSDESRRLDPKGVGVNIVLGAGVAESSEPPPPAPTAEGAPPAAPAAPAAVGVVGARKVTLNLRNVPMIDVLKFVTTLADLKYRIESSAVLILPPDAPEGQMITRTYHVNPGVFLPLITVTNIPAATRQTVQTSGGGGNVTASTPLTQAGPSTVLPEVAIAISSSNEVKQVFIDAGVQFPTNSAFLYFERTSTIIIHNTPENLETFERVLAAINTIPPLIEIEAKFVEVSQEDLDELGFHWKVGPYNAGDVAISGGNPATDFETGLPNTGHDASIGSVRDSSVLQGNAIDALLAASGFGGAAASQNTVMSIRGILTDPQFQVIITALSQKKSADVLLAPKVTTISGAQAQIRVAQEFIYPTTFTPPTAVSSAGNVGSAGVAATPSIPSAFASRPVGVVFNVTPTVGADGYTIAMTLIPQVTDFLGFINYGSDIALSAGDNIITVPNDIKQPLFTTRDVMTSIVIWDGQTVVLGGLIREDVQKIDDKIPFLGDLPGVGRVFRSKVTQRTKRNLLIFVTARLIDPAGNPVHHERS